MQRRPSKQKICTTKHIFPKHNTKNIPHDSEAQVALAVWTAFSITLEVSGGSDADAITELALKGAVTLPKKRI